VAGETARERFKQKPERETFVAVVGAADGKEGARLGGEERGGIVGEFARGVDGPRTGEFPALAVKAGREGVRRDRHRHIEDDGITGRGPGGGERIGGVEAAAPAVRRHARDGRRRRQLSITKKPASAIASR